MVSSRPLTDPIEAFQHASNQIPNPFEQRKFAFQVPPEEKDRMSRARKHSLIMPTLKTRLQQLLSTRAWEYMMLVLSLWSFFPLLFGDYVPQLRTFFELTRELNKAALCVEVVCKLYADWRWFFYDLWNLFDLACVVLNSPFVYNLFLSGHLGVPQLHSPQRAFQTLIALRLMRIHSLLRFVVETIFIALSGIYNTLLLEFVIVTVFALLSIAFEGDTSFWISNAYEPYENYTEALYSYYMCITLEGVNEVAEEILNLDSPEFTTAIGLAFYIFAAIVTYSVGQLLAAVIATYLGKAMDRVTREKALLTRAQHSTTLVGLQGPSLASKKKASHRCSNLDEVHNFCTLKPDDLVVPLILFRVLDQNMSEYTSILHDLRLVSNSIAARNGKNFTGSALGNRDTFPEQHRLQALTSVFGAISRYLAEQNELNSPLGTFLTQTTARIRNHLENAPELLSSVKTELGNVEGTLRTEPSGVAQTQRHLLILDRVKAKFFEKNHSR